MRKKMSSTAAPMTMRGFRRARCQSAVVRRATGWARAIGAAASVAIRYPWVHPGIHEVGEQIEQDEHRRDHEHDALHDRVIALADARDQIRADARPVKDELHD